jgi:serine/threonine protein kinase
MSSLSHHPTAPTRTLRGGVRDNRPTQNYPFLLPPATPDEIGRLGNYRVLRLLGRGGMAFVFEAEDVALDRRVALKVMKPELKEVDGWLRFLREARTMAAIKHDHLVTIYQAGQDGDAIWFAMELLDGQTLHEWLQRREGVEIAEVLRMARELTDGLAFLHRKGLVHRDIKPANIWLEGEPGASATGGRVKILDLGLVRPVEESTRLTDAGLAIGTPGFMSPEQARGTPLDARSDLFSLGCVLYELCTGRQPFRGDTTMAVLTALAVDTPPPVRELNPRVPPALAKLVARLLEKDPQQRPKSADEVRALLDKVERAPAKLAPTAVTEVVPEARSIKRKRPKKSARESTFRRWLPVILGSAAVVLMLVAVGTGVAVRSMTKKPVATPDAPATAFLTDLKPTGTENWPFFPPPGPDGRRPGDEVRVGGKLSPHGIFMHPPGMPGTPAAINYPLDGKYSRFRVEVAINDGPGDSEAACTFIVVVDGSVAWRSKPVKSLTDRDRCDISVAGATTLRISVTSAGPPRGAHCVWVEPILSR